ncbi:conserved hypothetical protein [Alteracholeplasma palmae J233]|uniref:PD-(D/E)XK motif protein n=1 Tax=Alteracholeplasma palmae (strain ATCC 49389 / J233) TaxID=1318466 RepID=U4KN60_ALTPJ|nr:PD-(D/E)XK motif protein [Alteracholeplasma palmae]CCV63605.1 conserved hypothetical protein [Alteracholeplasma palmae J233]
MEIDKLYQTLKNIEKPVDNSYNVVKIENSYYGISKEGYITFISETDNEHIRPTSQRTKHLFLETNMKCSLKTDEVIYEGIYNVLVCFESNYESIISFIQLTNVYSKSRKSTLINIKTFFETLKNLFSNKKQLPLLELQGLFGELYFMYYIQNDKFDISDFWQSKEKMKFDFSITEYNKIEIKTTTGDSRVHKFRHEQLVSDIYDTWIVSIMLRKDDQGLSLYELSENVKKNNPLKFNLHIRITNLLNNYTKTELEQIKFNENYIKSNMGFYRTLDIPRFQEKQPKGVYNTEYDADLSNVKKNNKTQINEWICKSLKLNQ